MNEWVLSFVLITEAEIKMSEGMDGWRREDRNWGISSGWEFAPALQWAFNGPPWHDTVQTSIFLCPPIICFALHKSEPFVFMKYFSITYSCSLFFALSLCSFVLQLAVCLLSFHEEMMNIWGLTGTEHLILFAQGNFLPHGVHVCYSSSNFLIEMETQFISFHFFLCAHVN